MRKFQKRAVGAPDQRYSTFTISSSSTPAGVRSFTTSPSSARSSALAMGEIQLTWPLSSSTSSTPTILTVRSSPLRVGAGHGGAEEHLVGLAAPGRVDHLGIGQPLAEIAHAAVDLAQALLAVDVVAVLRAVAVAGGPAHDLHHLRPLLAHQRRRAPRACGRSPAGSCSSWRRRGSPPDSSGQVVLVRRRRFPW